MAHPFAGPGPIVAGSGFIEAVAALSGNLIVGGLAILAGTRLVAGDGDLRRATITAGIGALVWAFLDGVVLLGPFVAALSWIALVRVRHDTGWPGAIAVGVVAWIVAGVLAFVLSSLGLPVSDVIGVPGA